MADDEQDRRDHLAVELQAALDSGDRGELRRVARELHQLGIRASDISTTPASADAIEAAHARAFQSWLDAADRVGAGDHGEGQRALNVASLALKDLDRQRKMSGKLRTAARDLEQLARDADELAAIELRFRGRTRFFLSRKWFALCQSATALRYRAIAAVLRPFGL